VGENDVRIDMVVCEELYQKAKSKDKSLAIIPGGYHQLYQDKAEVTQSVVNGVKDWILARWSCVLLFDRSDLLRASQS
jgi:alpha-beta hydrolase superfamily lysophospholipase